MYTELAIRRYALYQNATSACHITLLHNCSAANIVALFLVRLYAAEMHEFDERAW